MRRLHVVVIAMCLSGCVAHPQMIRTSDAVSGVYSAPKPIGRDRWFYYGDDPPETVTFGPVLVGSALTIRPDGSIQNCETLVSSRNPEIDDYTCALLKQKARFVPAKAPDGTPMHGVFRMWTDWGGRTPDELARNFKLVVESLPARVKPPVRVDIMFLVDSNGHPSSCTDQNNDDDPALVEIACQRLASEMGTPPVLTEENVPVPSVQDATVLFVEDSGR